MQPELRKIVDDVIEKELKGIVAEVGACESSIMFIGELIDGMYKTGNFEAGENLRPVLDILVPELLSKLSSTENKLDKIPFERVFDFSNSYHSLRDYIFMSFSIESSIEFSGNERSISVSVKDPTIFRQYVYERQTFALNSVSEAKSHLDIDDIVSLLKGAKQWDFENSNLVQALESIKLEVEWKIRHYFSHIPEDSNIDMGGYSYREFISIYKELLFLSLYERYHSKANDLSCVITYQENELANTLEQATEISAISCKRILRDISSSSRCTFIYLSSDNKYFLFPFSFSLKDGVSALLKQYAQKNSNLFSANCASVIGNSLVKNVASYFDEYKNFHVFKDISLQLYGSDLPDIDCLIVSYEPSLGFHFFVCEVKNNLPASWAKEYLKATGKKGFIEKALTQSKKISDFLKTDEGADLLLAKAMQAFPDLDIKKLFPTGFCGVIDYLIVTSQSMGMFFPDSTTTIIDNDMLRHIVLKSDGDVNFIQFHLHHLNEALDDCYSVERKTLNALGIEITYDICKLTGLFDIYQNKYLSDGTFDYLEKESIDTGYRFIDSIDLHNLAIKSDS
ncbi:hypothetical protein F991_02843 [Acinetobacter sp. CIP-A165]|uniref:hypothetical protein n=1 Tax=Acinetobacter sp. CIP-A165 TaxID=40373 RepID=UPI0002CDDFAE|nr:hypothetical protein [Acinetobacter sp. CIP-A165]ENU29281.1 hypothetical protein F991_02843 [Acinetobacter sp. CIP-A165]